jgi:hypothetical protein
LIYFQGSIDLITIIDIKVLSNAKEAVPILLFAYNNSYNGLEFQTMGTSGHFFNKMYRTLQQKCFA